MMKFYGYKKCSSCRDAEKRLTAKKIAYEFIDITLDPPTVTELRRMLKSSGLPLAKFLNTSGEVYRSLGLKDKWKDMSEDEGLTLLASNGKLIKRPLITDGEVTTVGANDEALKAWKA